MLERQQGRGLLGGEYKVTKFHSYWSLGCRGIWGEQGRHSPHHPSTRTFLEMSHGMRADRAQPQPTGKGD